MAAGYLSASVTLEIRADELFEGVLTGHDDIDLAEWLGRPIAGQPSDIRFAENFHAPAEGDADMAEAPADTEVTILATDEEIQAMLYPRATGNPTDMELGDDDPLRGNLRCAGDLSERVHYEFGHNEEFQHTSVASDRPMSR
eukprot:6611453-Pyramimonas_sp.AAC.1